MSNTSYFCVMLAMFGGVLGAVWTSTGSGDDLRRTLLEAAMSALAAAAVADYTVPPGRVWLCGAAGLLTGLLIGHALDVIRALAPDVVRAAIEGVAKKFLGYDKGGRDDDRPKP